MSRDPHGQFVPVSGVSWCAEHARYERVPEDFRRDPHDPVLPAARPGIYMAPTPTVRDRVRRFVGMLVYVLWFPSHREPPR